MQNATQPGLTEHRLARLTRWARLFLVWLAGAFAACVPAPRRARRRLDAVARMLAQLIFLHAAARVRAPARRANHHHGRLRASSWRSIAGAGLRRAMAGEDLPARLIAILCVMRDFDAHVARLARRLSCGLTRLRVIPPARTPAPKLAPAPLSPAICADTS